MRIIQSGDQSSTRFFICGSEDPNWIFENMFEAVGFLENIAIQFQIPENRIIEFIYRMVCAKLPRGDFEYADPTAQERSLFNLKLPRAVSMVVGGGEKNEIIFD